MKIVVTGASGMLGAELVPHLRSLGHEVLGLGRSAAMPLRADLTDAAQASAALDLARPEVIVNLAALTDVDACERQPALAYLQNVRTVENVVHWLARTGAACHLVQVSTDQVYDGDGEHAETDVTLSNYYGYSKYAGELHAASVPSTVLRTNFFGRSRAAGRASLSDWLLKSLSSGTPITVFDDVRFSPLRMRTLVEVLGTVIQRRPAGTYNLGSRHGMSKADFAFALAAALRLPVAAMRRGLSSELRLAAYRPKDMRMNSTRLERCLAMPLPTLADEITAIGADHDQQARQ